MKLPFGKASTDKSLRSRERGHSADAVDKRTRRRSLLPETIRKIRRKSDGHKVEIAEHETTSTEVTGRRRSSSVSTVHHKFAATIGSSRKIANSVIELNLPAKKMISGIHEKRLETVHKLPDVRSIPRRLRQAAEGVRGSTSHVISWAFHLAKPKKIDERGLYLSINSEAHIHETQNKKPDRYIVMLHIVFITVFICLQIVFG